MSLQRGQDVPNVQGGMFQWEVLEMLDEFLPEMLSARGTTNEKYIIDYLQPNAFSAVAEKCKLALSNEFKANMERIKRNDQDDIGDASSAGLVWILAIIRGCDSKLFDKMLRMFCEDLDLRDAITANHKTYSPLAIEALLDIMTNRILKAMGNREITPTSFGVSFLRNWLDTIVELTCYYSRLSYNSERTWFLPLEEAIVRLADTVSLADQRRIYHIWKDSLTKHYKTRARVAKEWWAKRLHDSIINQK